MTLIEIFFILSVDFTVILKPLLERIEMKPTLILAITFILMLSFVSCQKSDPEKNLLKFNKKFFQKYVPELPGTRLLQKSDLPVHQQQFFEEAGGQLQLLADLNNNGIPDYIVTGISIHNKIKKPYFIAIFERQETGIKRHFFQQIFVPPVTIKLANENSRQKVVISFAFYSGYGAEIYFTDGEYHLEKW